MSQVAESIWSDGNQGWDEFTVWLYLPGMEIKSLAYALVVFRNTELIHFKINHASR